MKKLFIFILLLVIMCKGLYAEQQPQPRIIGGENIEIYRVPWQVLVGEYCGGVIIAPNFILTAAHCLRLTTTSVYAGITNRAEATYRNRFFIYRAIPHPYADIALLQLESDIPLNRYRWLINYRASADYAHYAIGNWASASGWGWTMPGDRPTPADYLQAVNLQIISNQAASDALMQQGFPGLAPHEMAATGGGTNGRQGTCIGDSGGPLVSFFVGEPVLIGITARGVDWCIGDNQTSPSVFERVSYILDWINKYVCTRSFTNQYIDRNLVLAACDDLEIRNVTVTNGARLSTLYPVDNNIKLRDVFITNGAALTLNAVRNIYLYNVTIAENSRLILSAGGDIVIDGYLDIHLGAEFEMR